MSGTCEDPCELRFRPNRPKHGDDRKGGMMGGPFMQMFGMLMKEVMEAMKEMENEVK
jgi:hypothetical protein